MPEVLKETGSRKKQRRLNRKLMIERTLEFLQRADEINLTKGRYCEKSASATTFKKFWLKRVFKTSITSSRNGSCGSKSSCITTRSSRLSSSGPEDEAQSDSDFFTTESDSVGGNDADIEDFQESLSIRPKIPSLIEYYVRRRPGRPASLENHTPLDLDNEDVFTNEVHDCNHNFNHQLNLKKINPPNRKRIRTSASSRTSERSKSSRTLDVSTEEVFHIDSLFDNAGRGPSCDRYRCDSSRSPNIRLREPASENSRNSKNSHLENNDSDDCSAKDYIFIDKVSARNYESVYVDDFGFYEIQVDHYESQLLDSIDEGTIGDVEDCLDSDFASSPKLSPYYWINSYFERFYS